MNVSSINDFVVIHIFGSITLLWFIKLFNPLGVNKKGNLWFAFFLMLYSSFWMEEVAAFSGFELNQGWFTHVVHSLQIYTPVLLFISIVHYTNPSHKFKPHHLLHLVVPVVYMVLKMYGFVYSLESNKFIASLSIIIILSLSVNYVICSYYKIRRHQRQILLFSSNTSVINLNWLEYIIIQVVVVVIIMVLFNIFMPGTNPNLLVNSINLITVYLIAYYSLRQKEIFPVEEIQKEKLDFIVDDETEDQPKRKIISDEELDDVKQKLILLFVNEKPYLDSELNLVKLANILSLTPHQLSYAINSGFQQNFFQYVNSYRVNEAKKLLHDDANRTMLAIAFESGFNSKTAFNTTFKKLTELTPSQYKSNYGSN